MSLVCWLSRIRSSCKSLWNPLTIIFPSTLFGLLFIWFWNIRSLKPEKKMLYFMLTVATTQELLTILWNLKLHYRVHKSPLLVPILSMSIFFSLNRLFKQSVQVRGPLWHFVTSLFYVEELLAPRPTLKMEDHPLPAVRNCLFYISDATPPLHIWRPSPPSATWGSAMPWWQETHLTRI
jgi:hypothetical protein